MNEENVLVEEVQKEQKVKKRRKSYLKLNILSLFFTAVSFISVTLAWFAYSGLVTTHTEVNVQAWYIEFNNKGNAVSNEIVIESNDIHPGMETMTETIDIKNSGDSDAMISYKLKSVRILDTEYTIDQDGLIEDMLAHEFPFRINMSLSKNYANAHDGVGQFTVSVSWPLDGFDDALDTEWGSKAYAFQKKELDKQKNDSSYVPRKSIEIKLGLEAVQYVGEGSAPDTNYLLGSIFLFDVVNNQPCNQISNTCIKTIVIDRNNKLSDSYVTLLPDLNNTFASGSFDEYDNLYSNLTSSWAVTHRKLKVNDILRVVSKDVNSTTMVSEELSNIIVGNVLYQNRIDSVVNDSIKYNGYFRFKNDNFTYFNSVDCYWLDNEYDADKQFALVRIDELFSKVYGENKTSTCKVLPVLEVSKSKFNNESSN